MRFDLDLSFGTTKKNSNWELLYPICGTLVILILRNVCQKLASTLSQFTNSFGLIRGTFLQSRTPTGSAADRSEESPSQCSPGEDLLRFEKMEARSGTFPNLSSSNLSVLLQVRGLAKQLDVSAEEVESWLKLRSAQDRPSVLTKFCESFWRCCYYTLACTAEVLILWNKPWFWDLDQCWSVPFCPFFRP
jgi:hypothetical protein